MTSIKDYAIRFKKKGKTRGRPSKIEIECSKFLTEKIYNNDTFQSEFKMCIYDMLIYGTGVFDTRKIKI